jgi:hypothetical protein
MRRARRSTRCAAALVTVSALAAPAGCGSGGSTDKSSASTSSDSSSPSATGTSSVADIDMHDADAALPTADQVKYADTKGSYGCQPGRVSRNCPAHKGTTYATVNYYLDGTAAKQDIKQRNGTHWQPESVSMQVYQYADNATARKLQRRSTSAAEGTAGAVRSKPKRFGDGAYQLGELGKADYDAASIGGSPGYTLRIDRRYTSPSGKTSGPENVGIAATSFGRYLVYTTVSTWPSMHAPETSRAMARQLTEDYLERVQQAQ